MDLCNNFRTKSVDRKAHFFTKTGEELKSFMNSHEEKTIETLFKWF